MLECILNLTYFVGGEYFKQIGHNKITNIIINILNKLSINAMSMVSKVIYWPLLGFIQVMAG